MQLREYQFGYADAAKEYLLEPEIIEGAFFDPKGIINKLEKTWKYMVIGRKGVGKSAYSAKLQSISKNEGLFTTYPIPLNNFEYSIFSKTNSDSDVVGTKKYYESWTFVLLLTICKLLYIDEGIKEVEKLTELVYLLSKMGFSIEDSLSKSITKISKLKLGATVGIFDAVYEAEFGTKPISYTERLSALICKMKETIEQVYIPKKIFILIDGVDDILRLKKNQLEILSSLIRSIDGLNEYLCSRQIKIKVIIFIREDIVTTITDPDLNKIKRDGSINLSWSNNTNDLKSIVELRFKYSNKSGDLAENKWNSIFPMKIKESDSWEYLLEHTLYKPRDVLQFLTTCQELFPDKTTLTRSDMNSALKTYSKEYFIEEMKNELAGFASDSLITILPSVFKKLGSRSFLVTEFMAIINQQSSSQKYTESEIKYMLLLLFEAGYIGQLLSDTRGRASVNFKYRNTTANIDYAQKFITHRGLHKGLGIII